MRRLCTIQKPLLGKLAVAPMIFSEAFLPSARRLFWKPQRFPIADAHYAMGFAFLSQVFGGEQYYLRAVHFLEVLKQTRCQGCSRYCWGYPFHWETRRGTMRAENSAHNDCAICVRGLPAGLPDRWGPKMA